MSEPLRAAVIGASGVGKHHVKWLLRAGCDVVGFLGTSRESVERTRGALQETLGFSGAGYTSLPAMLAECRPQLVSVASPMAFHYEHVSACLSAGAHVLCEKPLVGHEGLATEGHLFLADRLVQAAEQAGVLLAVNTQYAAAAPHLRVMASGTGGSPVSGHERAAHATVTEFMMQMESRGQNRTAGHEQIWHDLAPHPISVLLALVPDGRVDWESVQCVLEEARNECSFDFVAADGTVCQARIILGNVPEGPLTRRFSLNGVQVDYEGRNDEDGVYCTYLNQGDHEMKARDFMEESLTRFAGAAAGSGEPLATGRTGLRNLEMQLRLIEGAERR